MASVEEIYKDLGVVHDSDCWVCDFEEVPGVTKSFVRALWAKWYAPWVVVVFLLVVAYVAALDAMYFIVGGL